MANDIEFINGLSFKAPNDGAPEYVKAKGSIKREELIAWLQTRDGDWVNFDLKVSTGGKWYVSVDNWKPNQGNGTPRSNAPRQQRQAQAQAGGFDDWFSDEVGDIQFATNRSAW